MDLRTGLLVLLVLIISLIIFVFYLLKVRSGVVAGLRPHKGYEALGVQVAHAVESGRRVHFGLGIGGLTGGAAPTSIASIGALDFLSKNACASDVPPLVTTGDGTLVLSAQDSLLSAYRAAGRSFDYSSDQTLFLSDSMFPLTYAAGASDAIGGGSIGSNLLIGRFGPEIAIIGEAGNRNQMDQVIGTDDPLALGVSMAITDKLLIGEELFAAGAYLEGDPAQLASLRLHDVLRLLVIAAILLATLLNLVIG